MNLLYRIFVIVLSNVAILKGYAASPQSLESFEKEFEWLNLKNCKRPSIKPPLPIWIDPPPELLMNEKRKISVRRWLDSNGDGWCEVYDVEELEKSYFTGRLYGYPNRRSRYENGKWKIQKGSVGSWFALILFDKVNKSRIDASYSYGNAGYTVGSTGMRSDCDSMRSTLAVGYMLFFHFPKFAKDDPAMDPEGIWNDYKSGYVESQYPTKQTFLNSPVSGECKEKYRLVIDALANKLEN